jgi:hypothetical protein
MAYQDELPQVLQPNLFIFIDFFKNSFDFIYLMKHQSCQVNYQDEQLFDYLIHQEHQHNKVMLLNMLND